MTIKRPPGRMDFNPHSREGSDRRPLFCCLDAGHFNPHSREGSDFHLSRRPSLIRNFNPHSREGSDDITDIYACNTLISIHTPARGVTSCVAELFMLFLYFNPHSREGSDHIVENLI